MSSSMNNSTSPSVNPLSSGGGLRQRVNRQTGDYTNASSSSAPPSAPDDDTEANVKTPLLAKEKQNAGTSTPGLANVIPTFRPSGKPSDEQKEKKIKELQAHMEVLLNNLKTANDQGKIDIGKDIKATEAELRKLQPQEGIGSSSGVSTLTPAERSRNAALNITALRQQKVDLKKKFEAEREQFNKDFLEGNLVSPDDNQREPTYEEKVMHDLTQREKLLGALAEIDKKIDMNAKNLTKEARKEHAAGVYVDLLERKVEILSLYAEQHLNRIPIFENQERVRDPVLTAFNDRVKSEGIKGRMQVELADHLGMSFSSVMTKQEEQKTLEKGNKQIQAIAERAVFYDEGDTGSELHKLDPQIREVKDACDRGINHPYEFPFS